MTFIPLSLFQLDIYFDQLLYPNKPIYNIGARVDIEGQLNITAFERAFRKFVWQHDVLSYRVRTHESAPHFIKVPFTDLSLQLVDHSQAADALNTIDNAISEDFTNPFAFESELPLFSFVLFKAHDSRYVLYSKYHHIIVDGWGTSLLFQRLVEYYNENILGLENHESEIFSYEKYLQVDHEYRNSSEHAGDKIYWESNFDAIPAPLFQQARKSSDVKSGREVLSIPRNTFSKISRAAADMGVSEFHIVLAALAFVLLKIQNKTECVASLPVLNRSNAYFKKTVGLFMGVSPLRITVDFTMTFLDYVTQIKDQLRSDYRHRKFPLSHLLQSLQLPRERSGLLDFSLSFEKHVYDVDFLETKTRVFPLSHFAERLPLSVYVREFDISEDVIVDFDYNYDYLNDDRVRALTGYFENVLENIIHSPHVLLRDVDFISTTEFNRVVDGNNMTVENFNHNDTILSLIDQWSTTAPDKVGLRDNHSAYTYSQLNSFSDRIASELRAGLIPGRNEVVGVLMDRSAATVLILLGILKSGHAYLPLDPSFPSERLKYIIENSGCELLITDEWTRDFATSVNCKTIAFTQLMHSGINPGREEESYSPKLDDKAYIIYTSGSTGLPKGVVISHGSLTNFLLSMTVALSVRQDDLLFSVTTYSFDISILEFFLPLINGATVFIAPSADIKDATRVIESITKIQPTIMQATPPFYQMLVNSGWVPGYIKILCGGDLLHKPLAEELIRSAREVWNMYGPTETTVWSTMKRMESGEDCKNVGKPIHNTKVYILDHYARPLPPGAIGKIFISGKGVALGYHRNPELTAERFYPNPFHDNGVMYDTGDLGMWTDEGEIIFMGRVDNQVKIRGHRIELAEVEFALASVCEAEVAVTVGGSNDELKLLAFLKGAEPIDTQAVRRHLKEKLPDCMIPDAISVVESFPLTPNNKIDRNKLAERFKEQPTEHVAEALTEREMVMMALWQQVLGVTSLDPRKSFFELGGHSIKANQLIVLVNTTFKTNLTLKEFFDNPFLKEMTALLVEGTETTNAITPAVDKECYAVSPSQMNFVDGCRLTEVSVSYNMYSLFSVTGNLSSAKFNSALDEIVRGNAILRTNFSWYNEVPKQVIRKPEHHRVLFQEVSAQDIHHVIDIAKNIASKPIDLTNDPLLKCYYITTSANEQFLFFITHHLIMDGLSFDYLINQLADHYNCGSSPQVSVQYHDYCEWINNQLNLESNRRSQLYWSTSLEGWTPSTLFARKNRRQSFQGKNIIRVVDHESYSNIYDAAATLHTSVYSVLLASLSSVISNTCRVNDFCIGVPFSARIHPAVSKSVGMFTNTVIVRKQVTPDMTFSFLVKDTHRQLVDSAAHQYYPLHKVIRDASVDAPPFEVTVSYLKTEIDHSCIDRFDGVILNSITLDENVSRLPIVVTITDVSGQLRISMTYDKEMYDEDTMEIFLERFHRHLLQLTAANVQYPLFSFDLRSNAEIRMASSVEDIAFNL